jgi:hypothetical protein
MMARVAMTIRESTATAMRWDEERKCEAAQSRRTAVEK